MGEHEVGTTPRAILTASAFGRVQGRNVIIALEYAYRRADKDPGCSVFCVHADNETTFVFDYKAIAKSLKISSDFDGDELLTAVRDRIEALKSYVLVLDNADNLTLFGVGHDRAASDENTAKEMARNMFSFVPRHSGTVLWTSRDKRIGGTLVSAKRTINVARMTDSEALVLLETVGNKEIGEGELNDAAAAYIRRMSITPTEYLSKLAKHRERRKLLGESEFDRHRRPGLSNSIFETWNISIEQIRRENKMAQNIPLEIMTKAAALLNKKMTDDKQGDESTKSVSSGSDSDDDDDEVLHAAILQEATQYALSTRDRQKDKAHFSKLTLLVVTDLFPDRRRERWEECEKYVVHVQRAAEWAEVCEGEIEASDLLSRVAGYMYDRGRWREKEPVDKRGYEFRRKRLGGRHPSTILSMVSLATTYHAQGRHEEAENIKVEVLALYREVLGEKHPNTIWSMADLARTYHAQGKDKEAEKIQVEVLPLLYEVLGEKHPNTLQAIYDLAITWNSRQRRPKALAMIYKCLQLQCEVLGEAHPDTRSTLHSLATLYG
ncbi:hypothetical protein P885DRAFT_72041 [Corynascus similis CBS 632.67]